MTHSGHARLRLNNRAVCCTCSRPVLARSGHNETSARLSAFGAKRTFKDAGHLRIFQPHPGTPSLAHSPSERGASQMTQTDAPSGAPTGPLAGLRILDISTVVAGPFPSALPPPLRAPPLKGEPPRRGRTPPPPPPPQGGLAR